MEVNREVLAEWNNACFSAKFGNYNSLKLFNSKYGDISKFISSMFRKRIKLNSMLKAYNFISPFIYWGCLTWNEDKINLSDKVKRNQALLFFRKYFKLYTFVEELGEDNSRYHIHFLALLNNDVPDYQTLFNSWHSRLQIECLTGAKCYRKIKYLTKYVSKQIPRIRMDKRSVKLLKDFKDYEIMKRTFPSLSLKFIDKCSDLLNLPF